MRGRLTGSTENLKHIEDSEIDELTLVAVVDLSSLDDDGVGRQVDSPSERSSATKYLIKIISLSFD